MREEESIFEEQECPEIAEYEVPVFNGLRLAYITAIDPDDARVVWRVIGSEIKLPTNVKLYALHAADGTTLGFTDSWAAAYGAAVQNQLVPVSVH